jgi:hypothetical protein
MRPPTRSEHTQHDLACWRRDQLLRAGFALRLADRLAREDGYDLHGLIELVESGCPPPLAVRILAPDDWNDLA